MVDWTTVRVPKALKEEVEDLISDKRLGFNSVADFAAESLRNRVNYYRGIQQARKEREVEVKTQETTPES